jgi:hypothetical protein
VEGDSDLSPKAKKAKTSSVRDSYDYFLAPRRLEKVLKCMQRTSRLEPQDENPKSAVHKTDFPHLTLVPQVVDREDAWERRYARTPRRKPQGSNLKT